MKFNDRKEHHYEQEVYALSDTVVALSIHDEYIMKHAGYTSRNPVVPATKFLEVDRSNTVIDSLWMSPTSGREQFLRELAIPTLVAFDKKDWRMTPRGLVPQQRISFRMSNLSMKRFDYFPDRGDYALYNGFRLVILNVVMPGDVYWNNTNVWLGCQIDTTVAIEGDFKPVPDLGHTIPVEVNGYNNLPDPKVI